MEQIEICKRKLNCRIEINAEVSSTNIMKKVVFAQCNATIFRIHMVLNIGTNQPLSCLTGPVHPRGLPPLVAVVLGL